MKNTCKELIETKPKKYMKIYECKLKKEIYFSKKETCKNCPKQYKIEFNN